MNTRQAVTVSLVSLVVAIVSTSVSFYLLFRLGDQAASLVPNGAPPPTAAEAPDEVAINLHDLSVSASAVPVPAEPGTAAGEAAETTPVPAGPLPPVQVSQMDANRMQRIEFNPPLGQVGRIHYDTSWGMLFMAVDEPDGRQAIWRLDDRLRLRRVLAGQQGPGEIFLTADTLGRLYANFARTGRLYRSEDLGDNWDLVADNIDGAFWAMADDGRGTLWAALHAYNKALLYRSTDDGRSWEVFKDFHMMYPELAVPYAAGDPRYRLRHLHSVAYQAGSLFVGVGDVARFTVRSDDGGESWEEVWDEGFTAWAATADKQALLFGPDKLQSHGIAWHDLASRQTKEVWSPLPHGFAGYTYSMMQMGDSYYAAFHTETNEVEEFAGHSGIIVSPDGLKWYPFLTIDKLTNDARTDMYLAPGRFPQYGHAAINGAVYRFEPPIGRYYQVKEPFE
jgi:hypothetical protein